MHDAAGEETARRRQPLALVTEREVPVHQQRPDGGGDQDQRGGGQSDQREPDGIGREAVRGGLDGTLDVSPRQVVGKVERDAEAKR
jgi:hypothetical protein